MRRLERSRRPRHPRIVHLGLGAFARAHLAEYTEDAGGWGIVGVAPRRRDVVEALDPQGGAYTLIERAERDALRVIECVCDVLHAPSEHDWVLSAIADADIVTLTVTEKAYTDDSPVIALLREALALRETPLTVLSLDNLPRNGEVLERLVGGGGHRFPCSMVDRVVPSTTPEDLAVVARELGAEDRGAVVAEPFRQWVIEDFDGPRPDWDALFVESSAPHEALKLRLLNGTHSLLAYAGLALGHVTVADAWADEDLRAVADRLATDDLIPTLPEVPGLDVDDYRATLDARWSNPRIGHRLEQIALDGQQKLPARFGGLRGRWVALAIAAWLEHEPGGDVSMFEPDAVERVGEWRQRIAADGLRAALRSEL
ncbi:mannitol dehydrogenase family protein [Solirubrobacter sp. CPCC 204708]|uniref:Mannitol dehydrogenase family protein n=1 Tax=Solirubrobacter deserti TaxID=2282478 RepID=A0ABT4RLV5_9ACTN|nr:mannitol dehydrogenase family protein [Solirubrobacter deserti]MBE2314402.1 mannitol dehydrogenase family protein [Solirubrobacter deserti]MDA0139549.1 mannitol dehydrogenase family protein [Solirubrobacter deserti]